MQNLMYRKQHYEFSLLSFLFSPVRIDTFYDPDEEQVYFRFMRPCPRELWFSTTSRRNHVRTFMVRSWECFLYSQWYPKNEESITWARPCKTFLRVLMNGMVYIFTINVGCGGRN